MQRSHFLDCHIGVLMGGVSSERDISLKSGQGIHNALKSKECHVSALDLKTKDRREIINFINRHRIDLAFIALHGEFGEDGQIQDILEEMEIPYTGSGVMASQRAIDKFITRKLCELAGIRMPRACTLNKGDEIEPQKIIERLKTYPLVVKPTREGSSIGVSIVKDDRELTRGIQTAWQFGEKAVVEAFIAGREMTIGILGRSPLPIVEIRPKTDFYNYKSKYTKGMTNYIVPAVMAERSALEMQAMAIRVFNLLCCEDLARVDFILSQDETPYLLEVNTIPGFTETSLLPKAAREIGLTYEELCLKLVGLAYAKKKEKKDSAVTY